MSEHRLLLCRASPDRQIVNRDEMSGTRVKPTQVRDGEDNKDVRKIPKSHKSVRFVSLLSRKSQHTPRKWPSSARRAEEP